VIIKPSKYGLAGEVERFRRGFMPNSTITYLRSMTPTQIDSCSIETHIVDEYVQTDLDYLKLLRSNGEPTLVAIVGVQSHQFHRSLDLAAYALANGVKHCVIGGPHPMTCDTTVHQNRGVSFALAEAEVIWPSILHDAIHGELEPVYGLAQRWQQEIDAPVLIPPSSRDLRRYVIPMMGLYPARGCPFTCNFCSVIKIAGRQIRGQQVETTMASLRAAKQAGVRLVMFTSDNFNKYPDANELLQCMIDERINIPFFVQCDTQVAKEPEFVDLLGRAGCFQMFVGVESFRRKTLLAAHKAQNHPETYIEIVRLCQKARISSHFSNIIGFPGESEPDVREHVRVLRSLEPDLASFYILTPIPGTDQYEDFLAAGWITERNLDRFDGQQMTWTHDAFEADELQTLLFDCYRSFYSSRRIGRTLINNLKTRRIFPDLIPGIAVTLFHRYCAWKQVHPMSGGVGRIRRDSASDYRRLRRARYDLEMAPLPRSLELSKSDAELNRRVKLVL
jgi:radical SAM superfamily enzyme YgiQ (UPF0313 family)